MCENTNNFELNTGAKIPSIGVGTFLAPPHTVATAIKLGYRHIDCASDYGNEKQIGQILKELFEQGVLKREDLFITSKLANYDHEPEDVPKALDRTLADLQLDYLDLYLIHSPVKEKKAPVSKDEKYLPPDLIGTWKAMEGLYDSGKVKAVGVSNFSTKKLQDILDVARIVPAVNQVECHPMWQQAKMRELCKSKGIHLSGYAPLGRSQSEVAKNGGVLQDPVLIEVAKKLGKSPAQVAICWGIQMGHSVLPKTSSEARLIENFDVFDWSIPQDLFFKLSEIKQVKFVRQYTNMFLEKSAWYKTVEELWDGEI